MTLLSFHCLNKRKTAREMNANADHYTDQNKRKGEGNYGKFPLCQTLAFKTKQTFVKEIVCRGRRLIGKKERKRKGN